jgi:hypothetical protein
MENNSNRRSSERHPAQLVIAIQPLSAARRPQGIPLSAVSVDLSRGGSCFLSDHPLLTDFALVEIQAAGSEQTISLLAERVRCRRTGGMFEIAVKFIEKIDTAS